MRSYSDAFAGCSTTVLGAQRAADIVAALTPPPATGEALVPASPPVSVVSSVTKFVPSLVSAGIGAVIWKKHRVLGALAGHAAINAGYDYYKGNQKKAICNLIVEGAGIAGALHYKKSPLLGWLGGIVAGAAVTYFVDGSPVKQTVANLRK